MSTPHALRFVSSAIRHADQLADEADDLGQTAIADRLRARATSLAIDLEQAIALGDAVDDARRAREEAHRALVHAFTQHSLEIEQRLPRDVVTALTPGRVLDVPERARFRLRRWREHPACVADPTLRVRLEDAVLHYEHRVDVYLTTSASSRALQDRVVVDSQALRVELERSKAALLVVAPVDSDAYRRIRSKTVRTKRARWIDDARARDLLVA